MQTSVDGILNQRIKLEQPKDGYRVAVDTVLLAGSVAARAGDKILDLGCGVGGALLALACRIPKTSITGIEIQDDLVKLCRSNIQRNFLDADLKVELGDATKLPPEMSGYFDHVMMNPPYHDTARHDTSPNRNKRISNAEEDEGDLEKWISSAVTALKPGGAITLIHRADRMNEILRLLSGSAKDILVKPIFPKEGAVPKRVVVRAFMGNAGGIRTLSPFVLHNMDGSYSEAADGILRHMEAVPFV
ncbi:MAG: methyltransferase [Alphaproteobacteria bacterium]|nr:methyltransferase [Alphaproteobacteria bacterium]